MADERQFPPFRYEPPYSGIMPVRPAFESVFDMFEKYARTALFQT